MEPILDDGKIIEELKNRFDIDSKDVYRFVLFIRNMAWGKGYNQGLKDSEDNYYEKESK